MKSIKIGLIGFGNVGSAIFDVFNRNADLINNRLRVNLKLAAISIRNLDKAKLISDKTITVYPDPFQLIYSDVDIVIEVIGGIDIAKKIVEKAIQNKKHVVTANKELIAIHGKELLQLAKENGVLLLYEAAVGGGIPIIKSLREGLSANKIEWVAGIINGTTNYILTEMQRSRGEFSQALQQAIKKGYAEKDPTFDIEGIDAAHKLAIIASLCFDIDIQYDKVFCEGIANIELKDIDYAKKFGYAIKLLGIAKRRKEGLELRVHPSLVPIDSMIANIDLAMNGILVFGDAVGPTLHYGAGAGGEPTASSILADVMDAVRFNLLGGNNLIRTGSVGTSVSDKRILLIDDTRTSYYLRMRVRDQVGVMADVTQILAAQFISIEAMFQGEPLDSKDRAEVVIITHQTIEKNINTAIMQIENLHVVDGSVKLLRIESLEFS